MSKFSEISKGTFARRRIELDVNGTKTPIDVRVLTPQEEADVLAQATAFARTRGVERPDEGDTLFDLGRWIYTAAIACVDVDSPENGPRPFFDGGVEQIINSKAITRTHLAYIFEHHELWQDECSPYEKKLNADELLQFAHRIAEGDIHPFVALPPATRWLLVRGLAVRLVSSLGPRSPYGFPSPESMSEPSSDTNEETRQ